MRFDQYLVSTGIFESRNKASAAVKEGSFTVNGKIVTKPAHEINEGDRILSVSERITYVARSAHKLLRAFDRFDLRWEDKVIADFGASTGGFCQVLLANDVKKIFAVDIGTAQLHPSVKNDPRIINMEHTNARYLDRNSFSEPIHAITADLSFISIKSILPAIEKVLSTNGEAVVLVKPQFEVGPQNLTKKGVVKDRKLHLSTLEEVCSFAEALNLGIYGISFSGLAGESGNREYLLYLIKGKKSIISISNASYAAVYLED